MASVQLLLALGSRGTLNELKCQWINHNNACGRQWKVSQSAQRPKARHFSVCCTAPATGWKTATGCRAHVKAIGETINDMTITSVNLVHTCIAGDVLRKCNYLTRHIASVSEALSLCQPTTTKSGNNKQCRMMAKAATSVSVKTGQAALAVRSECNDTMEAHLGQHFWTPSLFKAFQEDDPAGSFDYETRPCRWDRTLQQFFRCYVALSFAKHFWKHSRIDIVLCDGAHTRGTNFRQIILIACTFDGNNQVTILAFAIVPVKDSENWVWFKEKLDDDFPGYNVWISDADKGTTSNAFNLSQSQTLDDFLKSRCARHMSENCKEVCKSGSMNEDQKLKIIRLVKSRTQDIYEARLEVIKDMNESWSQYLDARRDEFVSFTFLDRGVRRFGKVTSNGVENINSAISDERGYSIAHVLMGLIECQQKQFRGRQEMSTAWNNKDRKLTGCAQALDLRLGADAQKREVQMLECNPPIYRAKVQVGIMSHVTGFVEVKVDVNTQQSECPCRQCTETGTPCVHVNKGVLLAIEEDSHLWCDECYHLTTHTTSHSASVPGMATAGRLEVDDNIVPPECKKPAGRPQKKRQSREHLRKTNVRRLCKSCGQEVHMESACDKPSTEYRHKQHKKNAIKWCKRQQEKEEAQD